MSIRDGRPQVKRGVIARPYREAAWWYYGQGWRGVIPVARHGSKAPLVKGVTGHDGRDMDDDDLEKLVRMHSTANIGLRLPLDLIGLDVDAYDGRNGGQKLLELESRLGPLPQTWRSTSRAPEDEVSGIYLFRAPRKPDWLWVSDLGPGSGIEIIQRHHRFVTAPPSVHVATGRKYRWIYGYGKSEADRLPLDVLPLLPVEWARFLRSPRAFRPTASVSGGEASEWLARAGRKRRVCPLMLDAVARSADDIRHADRYGGLHDAITRVTWNLTHYAAEGHRGLIPALERVASAVARSSRARGLRSEWERSVTSAVAHAAAQKQASIDPCSELRGLRATGREQ